MALVFPPKPTLVPGLPSPYETVGGLVYFPRMIAKIRLHAEGKLPESHVPWLGVVDSFDGICTRFLKIDYPALKERTLSANETPEELLEWCCQNGHRPNEEEIEIFNAYLTKAGWRDGVRESLVRRLEEANLPLGGSIETMFDYIDYDEGRPLRSFGATGA